MLVRRIRPQSGLVPPRLLPASIRTPHGSLPFVAGRVPPSSRQHASVGPAGRPLSADQERPDRRPLSDHASRPSPGAGRHLATAFEHYKPGDETSLDVISTMPPFQSRSRPWDLQPWDHKAPLIVREISPPTLPKGRSTKDGIPGDSWEILCVLDACLRVSKLERAAMLLKRLNLRADLEPEVILQRHNYYLRAMVEQLEKTQDQETRVAIAEELHKWFEVQIRSNNLPYTSETLGCLLKATLLTATDTRLNMLVPRYMSMIQPQATALEILWMDGYLSAEQLDMITAICPTYDTVQPNELLMEDETDEAVAESLPHVQSFDTMSPELAEALGIHAPTDAVRTTPQKGEGLSMLRETLSLFNEIQGGDVIASLPEKLRREFQSRLERDSLRAAVDRWRKENEKRSEMGLNISRGSLNGRLYDWQVALTARLEKEIDTLNETELEPGLGDDQERCVYGPFLRQSDPKRLAALTILSVMSILSIHGVDVGVGVGQLVVCLARAAEQDAKAQDLEKRAAAQGKKGYSPKKILPRNIVPGKQSSPKMKFDGSAQPNVVVVSGEDGRLKRWPIVIQAKVGAFLAQALIETATIRATKEDPVTGNTITELQPAFTHGQRLSRGKKMGVVVPNPYFATIMKREPRAEALARHLPMVVEPMPWTLFDKGGFFESSVELLRIKEGDRDQKIYAEVAVDRGDMTQVLRGLDVLGRTGWRINHSVYKVMIEAWNSGVGIANIPPLEPDLPIPPEPADTADPIAKRQWQRKVKTIVNTRMGLHSERCFMNLQLEIARAFKEQVFYFPHNVDFRGRAYPIPTYLHHMGADHVRGLLTFATGRRLGEAGLRWLKVHLANVYGFDKASLAEREQFAMDNWDNIRDSTERPLTGGRWWLKAEDPWQTLATCFELKAAHSLPDPCDFPSRLPVHQDGTCNGLQHYAALGGDEWGAQQVNLEPSDRPADVYSAVARLVQEKVEKDAAEGNLMAKAVDGKITRKVVKQTVMTNVYGVTWMGAKKQVMKQLEDLYPTIQKDTGHHPIVLASYIASKIFQALANMFSGAHDIQRWLGEAGGRICYALPPHQLDEIAALATDPPPTAAEEKEKKPETKRVRKTKAMLAAEAEEVARLVEQGMSEFEALRKLNQRAPKPVKRKNARAAVDKLLDHDWKSAKTLYQSTLIWTTPLRMPVVQPYRKTATKQIKTCIQDISLVAPDASDPVDRRKQLQAFPPNFIHSLDASHMLLSALECDEMGLTFAAVHDSFWTHAADVDVMNGILRDAFIRIHSDDVIGRLAVEFEARYDGSIYMGEVKRTSAAGKVIIALRKEKKKKNWVHLYGPKKTPVSTCIWELLEERERQNLLRSKSPADVAKGKAMLTPASILEEFMAAAAAEGRSAEAAGVKEDTADVAPLFEVPSSLADGNGGSGGSERERPVGEDDDDGGEEIGDEQNYNEDGPMESAADAGDDCLMGDSEAGLGMEDGGMAEAQEEGEEYAQDQMDSPGSTGIDAMERKKMARLSDAPKPSSPWKKILEPARVKISKKQDCLQLWLPLKMPPLPKKGGWDVNRLRKSEYFFS